LSIKDENNYILGLNSKNGIEFLIDKLQEKDYFWSASLILYHISEKDAIEIWAIFSFTECDPDGFINCSDEDLSYLENEYKEEVIRKWQKWYANLP
jgi:hypothetical protein